MRSPTKPRPAAFAPSARWIWDGGEPMPVDAYRLFRKTFTLRRRPRSARLAIAADRDYRLWINGQYVGRGPAPNPAAHASYDEHAIAERLVAGKNVIAVLVHHAGVPTFQTELGRAGLLVSLSAGGVVVASDRSWRWRDAWWRPTGHRLTIFREHREHLDLRRQPVGWTEARFDDRTWGAAAEIGPVGCAPWTSPEARDIPSPDHRAVSPAALLFVGSCDAAIPPQTEVAPAFAREPQRPVVPGTAVDLAALIAAGDGVATIDARAAGVIVGIDWGREVSGMPEIEVESDAAGAVIDLGYGEGLDGEGHVTVTKQDYHAVDRLTLRRGAQTARIHHHRAFRYGILAIRGGRVRLRAPRLIESGYPVVPRGAFSCADARLTRAWDIGRETMRLCMDQSFMDCPHRERGQYIGDALVESAVALYAFGDTALIRRFLRQGRLCRPDDGLLDPCYPSDWIAWQADRHRATPSPQGRSRIPGFGLLWIELAEQHWRDTGDRALMRELAPVVDGIFGFFTALRGADGLIAREAEWNFIDWVKLSPEARLACLNLQLVLAARAAERLDAVLGRPTPREREPAALMRAFDAAHWDERAGMYRDAPGAHSIHTNALALLALDLGHERAMGVADRMLASPAEPIGSPYFEGFALRGLCRWGRHRDALARIAQKWGPMIDAGATTFWEHYSGRASLCHAWSSEPTALLSRDILGVSWSAPERLVRIAPNPGALAWAQGVVPLPCGDVTLRWDAAADGLRLHLSAPEAVTVELDLPAAAGAVLLVDGEEARDAVPGRERLRARLRGGARVVAVQARGRAERSRAKA